MTDKNAGPTPDSIMTPADMRPLLLRSKHEPVHCAIGLTDKYDAVVLLDHKIHSRRLLALLREKATAVKLGLDHSTLRFGMAVVDSDVDANLVRFIVNKPMLATSEQKLHLRVKGSGFLKVEIVVDEVLDSDAAESEEARI